MTYNDQCTYCNKSIYRNMVKVKHQKKIGRQALGFCNLECRKLWHRDRNRVYTTCKCCGIDFWKRKAEVKHTLNNFCSRSCSATYHNTHKTKGTRRSKLELWLEQELTKLYPTLEIHYCHKDAINSELDIYIPSLMLAFELNGIFHYEPIYGQDKLNRIQNNDDRKFQACLEKRIELVIIDSSKFTYFKVDRARPFLKIIEDMIEFKLQSVVHDLHMRSQ